MAGMGVGIDGAGQQMSIEQVARPPWIRVAAGSAVRSSEPVVRPRRVFAQVTAAALVVLVAVALAGAVGSQRVAEAQAVDDATKTASLLAEAVVQPALSEGLLTSSPAAMRAMDQAVREHVLGDSIIRVKIWDSTGRILYSDAPALIGQRFPLGTEERDVLANPQTRADVSDLTAPENRLERGRGKLLEVYRPIRTQSGNPLLFETYSPYAEVTARAGQLWRGFAGVTLTSLVLLVILLYPILWQLLNRLQQGQLQREALLQRAVDASGEERRRIAGALHEGVVQDLAAASFTAPVARSAMPAACLPVSANEVSPCTAATSLESGESGAEMMRKSWTDSARLGTGTNRMSARSFCHVVRYSLRYAFRRSVSKFSSRKSVTLLVVERSGRPTTQVSSSCSNSRRSLRRSWNAR